MELSSILDALADNPSTAQVKTASAVEASPSQRLESALDAALSMDKTASYSSGVSTPSNDLVKIAQKLADAEQLALVKEAELYGAAVCDGFIARMGEHEGNGVKVASFGGGDVDDVLIKQAMELGYRETKLQLEGMAKVAFEQGYNDTIKQASLAHQQDLYTQEKIAHQQKLIKVAAEDRANTGYSHAMRILSSLA
jgi:hypothetical protein